MTRPILLVEDNPDDIELTKRALAKNRIANEVIIARDGAEALDILFAEDGPCPAVMLLDLKLPKIGGLEVLRQVRANPRTCLFPVVILTSSREERDLVETYSAGANSYVRKPLDFAEFLDAVNKLGVYWLLLNETPSIP